MAPCQLTARGCFLTLHSGLVRAAPRGPLGPVLSHHGASLCWILMPEEQHASQTNLSHLFLFSLSQSPALFFLLTYSSTSDQTMHPSIAMPSSMLGLAVRKLSDTSKTTHQHLEYIELHTIEVVGHFLFLFVCFMADVLLHGRTGR